MDRSSFVPALKRQVVPTPLQGLVALSFSAAVLLFAQMDSVAKYLGITNEGVETFADGLHTQTSGILSSSVASNLVLVTFWGIVGLIAYLVTWAAVNFYIEARNQVTIDTKYANRGHWRGPGQTLAIKVVCAILLVAVLALVKYGIFLAIDAVNVAMNLHSIASMGLAVAAWLGLATLFYTTYLMVILTFTPWYRTLAFTE